jgi:hypothetical protein
MNAKARARLRQQRTEELRAIKAKFPELEVWEFSPIHLRLKGSRSVDYWPGTGRAWITNSFEGSMHNISPLEVVALAFERSFDEIQNAVHGGNAALDREFRLTMQE